LRAWQHRKSRRNDDESLPEWVREALKFFVELLPALPGRKFFFGTKRRKRRPVIVYTDAMYDGAKTPACMLGIVIYDPEDPEHRWRYASGLCAECGVRCGATGGRLWVCARGGLSERL
jgi:hypothetical protein